MVTLKYAKKGVGYVAEYCKTVDAATEAALAHTDLDEAFPVTIVDGDTVIREFRKLFKGPEPKKPKGKKDKDKD